MFFKDNLNYLEQLNIYSLIQSAIDQNNENIIDILQNS